MPSIHRLTRLTRLPSLVTQGSASRPTRLLCPPRTWPPCSACAASRGSAPPLCKRPRGPVNPGRGLLVPRLGRNFSIGVWWLWRYWWVPNYANITRSGRAKAFQDRAERNGACSGAAALHEGLPKDLKCTQRRHKSSGTLAQTHLLLGCVLAGPNFFSTTLTALCSPSNTDTVALSLNTKMCTVEWLNAPCQSHPAQPRLCRRAPAP